MDSQAGPSASASAEAVSSTSGQQQGDRAQAPSPSPTTSSLSSPEVLPPTPTEWAIKIPMPEGMSEAECISRKTFLGLPYSIHVEFAKTYNLPDAEILSSEEICDALCTKNRWIPPLGHHIKIPAPDGEGIIVSNDIMDYVTWKVEQVENKQRSASILPEPDDVYSFVRREEEEEDEVHPGDEDEGQDDGDETEREDEDEDDSELREGEVRLELPIPQAGETRFISPIPRVRGMPPPPFVYPPKGRSWSGEEDRKIIERVPADWFDRMATELENSYEFLKAAVETARIQAREARLDVVDTISFIEREMQLQKEVMKKIANVAGKKVVDRIEGDVSYALAIGELPVRFPGEDDDELDFGGSLKKQATTRIDPRRRQREVPPGQEIRRMDTMVMSSPRKKFHIVGTPPAGFKYPASPASYQWYKYGNAIDQKTYSLAQKQRSDLRNNTTRPLADVQGVWDRKELDMISTLVQLEAQRPSTSNESQSSSTSLANNAPPSLPQANAHRVHFNTNTIHRAPSPVRASLGPDILRANTIANARSQPPPPSLRPQSRSPANRAQIQPEAPVEEEVRGRRTERVPIHDGNGLRSALRKRDASGSANHSRGSSRVRFAESVVEFELKRSRSTYEDQVDDYEDPGRGNLPPPAFGHTAGRQPASLAGSSSMPSGSAGPSQADQQPWLRAVKRRKYNPHESQHNSHQIPRYLPPEELVRDGSFYIPNTGSASRTQVWDNRGRTARNPIEIEPDEASSNLGGSSNTSRRDAGRPSRGRGSSEGRPSRGRGSGSRGRGNGEGRDPGTTASNSPPWNWCNIA